MDLPTPPLPEAISKRAGARSRLGEGDQPALGVPVRVGGTRAGRGIAVQLQPQRLTLLVGHHREVEDDGANAVEGLDGRRHPLLDLGAQRAPGDREGHSDADGSVASQVDVAHHAEIDDGAPQLGILDGLERLDDLVGGDGHEGGAPSKGGENYHYGDR